MVWNQLYAATAYFPMLSRLDRQFVIPPLHIDLAIAMENPGFRRWTTFDNRQWMDIRGVGSGATGIEYVERGAHLERNVTLHEYVHLFHGSIFTDAEMRKVRERYYYAMKNGLTLDYYSENNEFEYLAQTYPAYFIPEKVHPLNHKSVNITRELQEKDPLMFAFIDSLVQKQKAFLAGDKQAMADNWAEVYVKLAGEEIERDSFDQSLALLDTAYAWDSTYLPALLMYANSYAKSGNFESANKWLERARILDGNYAPVFSSQAKLEIEKFIKGSISESEVIRLGRMAYNQAEKLETDLAEQASLNHEMRSFFYSFCLTQEAIEIAETYAAKAHEISTYLQNQKDEALAFVHQHKGQLGYESESIAFFKDLIRRKPQAYQYFVPYADVLAASGKYQEATNLLANAQKLLKAANNPNPLFWLKMASYQLKKGDKPSAKGYLIAYEASEANTSEQDYLIASIYAGLGEINRADKLMAAQQVPVLPEQLSDYHYTLGHIARIKGDLRGAIHAWEKTLRINMYQMEARFGLIELYELAEKKDQVKKLAMQGALLPIPPGEVFMDKLQAYLEE